MFHEIQNVKVTISAKLGRMRKEQRFYILRGKDDPNLIIIQSDKSIGQINLSNGIGKLNTKGSYFPDLINAVPFEYPPEFIQKIREKLTS